MKKIFSLFVIIVSCLVTFSQQSSKTQPAVKNDIILKLNGDELTGKVSKISDSDVEFSYAGEDLTYTIRKSDIMKITFASGRIEVFNKPALPSETKPQGAATTNPATTTTSATTSSLEDHHNKVAVLPFSFAKDGQLTADVMADEVQNECYSYMSKHSGVYTILDPRTTNALLIKAGVTKNNIKGYTMADLCNILGVEYVVDGMVSQNKTVQTTMQSNSGDIKQKNNNKATYNSYSYGTATQSYKTNVNLGIYNDKGVSVYSQDRNSFWATQDAYKNTLEYLLKRSPLYSK
jgi:TolB-like protein